MTQENKPKRPRKTGSLFLRGATFWVQFSAHGRVFRESAKTDKIREAERYLSKRLAEVHNGSFSNLKVERITVAELANDLLRDHRINGKKSIDTVEARWRLHLAPFFYATEQEDGTWANGMRAAQITSETIARYVDKRTEEGAEPATVNRELSLLKRALKLGAEATPPKVRFLPAIKMLKESNVRTGFLEDADYDRLAAECAKEGLWLRAMLACYYTFGWRKSEVLGMRVHQVDLPSRTIRLDVGTTKNSQGRTVKMTEEVFTLLSACVHGKAPQDRVFTRDNGKPVLDIRKVWRKVCIAAGVGELLLHDLRRSGARNLRRLGVGETVAMKIGGWRTASVFRRYDIVSESDLADAARRLDEKRLAQKAESSDTNLTQSRVDVDALVNVNQNARPN